MATIEPLVEQEVSHHRCDCGDEIEKARHRRRSLMPDQPVKQADRSDRQHHCKPAQCKNELRGPVHDAILEQERADGEEHGDRDVLHEIAAAPVDVSAEAALVQRAKRDAEQRDGGCSPAPSRLPAHRPVMKDQGHADEPEQKPAPLQRCHALAKPAISDGRGQQRLQARHQRRETSGDRQGDRDRRAAEIEAVHQNAGDDTVADSAAIRPDRANDGADDRHQHHHNRHADREIGQRIGIVNDVFGADEAGAPEHDENRRRRACGEFVEVLGHLPRTTAQSCAMRQHPPRKGRPPATT